MSDYNDLTWDKKEEKRLIQLYINTKRMEYGFNTMSKKNIIKIWMMETLLLLNDDDITEYLLRNLYEKEERYYDNFLNSGIIIEEKVGKETMIHLNSDNYDIMLLDNRFKNIEKKKILNQKIEFDNNMIFNFENLNINNNTTNAGSEQMHEIYDVLSSDRTQYYTVNNTEKTCTCLGFRYRKYCKHVH